MNHPLVRRQLPLAQGKFDDNAYQQFLSSKIDLWEKHGYGPWAIFIDQRFSGWGGLQYEEGDPDLALVLHPEYWGVGKKIYEEIIQWAFKKMQFEYITALLPSSRKHDKALLKLNFKSDGQRILKGIVFFRFKLTKEDARV